MSNRFEQVAAQISVPTTWTATAFAWLADVNEILQFISLVVAITSGVWAWRYYRAKLNDFKRKD